MSGPWRLVVRAAGGPEQLERESFESPSPARGEVLIRASAIGLNLIDVYHRTGLYPRAFPTVLGQEGAGTVEAVGEGVGSVAVGDRVGFLADGAYATHVMAREAGVFPLPDDISDELAAAALLKGLTAWMLVERCARVEPGQTVLVHSAAGGVGSILVQWLHARGAVVIAHSGSAEKAAVASALGADHSLHCPFAELAAAVRGLTGGTGANVVLDGVGGASWDASIGAIAKRGILVSYGNASGIVPPVPPLALTMAGSIFLARPSLFDWIERPEDRDTGWKALTEMLGSDRLKIAIGQRYPLADAADAHRAIEARRTTGSTVLIP